MHGSPPESPPSVPQSVGLIDQVTWRPVYVSPSFERIWGHPPAALRPDARRFLDWVHPDDRERMQQRLAEPIEGCRAVEFRILREDGSIRRLYSYTAPMPSAQGRSRRLLGVVQDVTAAHAAEQSFRRRTERLQAALREAHGRVQELERERAELERSAALARMASRIVDGINSPLAGIKNAALLMHDAVPLDHPRHRYVGLISREVERVIRIVRPMVQLGTAETDWPRTTRVRDTVLDAVALMEPSCDEGGIRVEVDFTGGPAEVALPEHLLRQALDSVLENAIEASRAGDVVTIAVDVDSVLTIRVRDAGDGIPAELLGHVFTPFFTTKTPGAALRSAGLGLGLSLAKAAVQAMRGSITLRSEPGRGTTCTMTFPLADGGERYTVTCNICRTSVLTTSRIRDAEADELRRHLRHGCPNTLGEESLVQFADVLSHFRVARL